MKPRLPPELVDQVLTTFKYPAIRPYVREIILFVDRTAKWTETQLPKLLAQFPACKALRLAGNWNLLPRLHMTPELELSTTARDSGIVTLLRGIFTFPSFARRNSTMAVESNEAEDPTVVQTPLARVDTVHLDFPLLNSPVLALLAPPAIDTPHIMLQDSDPEAVHVALRAAGAGLRALVLRSRTNLLIGRPATPLASQLRYVLAVPSLEELVIETQEFDMDEGREIGIRRRETLDRLLQTLPALRTAYPHMSGHYNFIWALDRYVCQYAMRAAHHVVAGLRMCALFVRLSLRYLPLRCTALRVTSFLVISPSLSSRGSFSHRLALHFFRIHSRHLQVCSPLAALSPFHSSSH
ncbi:hypothetical protein B0H13DRAFT_2348420 [Mycena leptocephala]|nr:hypothetical protein B0H13DRAFT_2348420 [Mycena leptocephala]